jgi:hypothetical protein
VGLNRYAKKVDSTQAEIVAALRKAGIQVWIISTPADLLTLYHGRWRPLECKPPKRKRNDQPEQDEFLKQTKVPVVRTPEDAIVAVLRS